MTAHPRYSNPEDAIERMQILLATLTNAARLCREAGAAEEDVYESVAWGWKTPEQRHRTDQEDQ